MNKEDYIDMRGKVGRRMQQIRRMRDLSQERAGEMAEVDRVSIGYYEQNRRAPSLQTLFKLSTVYEVEIREFFDFEHLDDEKSD